jgi:glycosyltransferase involved in cell wall biosynthesis
MRIAVVTPFPLRTEPFRGRAQHDHVIEIARWAEVRVFIPHPRYPQWRWLHPRGFLYQRENSVLPTPGLNSQPVEFPVLPAVTRPLNAYSLSRRLQPLLAEFRPDIVLAYCIYPDACGALLAARRLKLPVVVGSMGSDLRRISDPLTERMVRFTVGRANFVLAVSSELIQRAVRLGAEPARAKTIPCGCDTTLFYPVDRARARQELGVATESELIVFVGRLVELKGVAELLAALEALAPRRPRLELALVGDGPLLDAYCQRVERAGLASRVRFLRNLPAPEVARWLGAADVFCLPSHSEGCPNSVIEALACGRPVVASNVGGIPDLVKPSCGTLVPPHNADQLAAALDQALARFWDPYQIASSFGRTWRDMATETYDVCCRVLGRPASREVREAEAVNAVSRRP